VVVVVVAS
jgi:hypothetical protein